MSRDTDYETDLEMDLEGIDKEYTHNKLFCMYFNFLYKTLQASTRIEPPTFCIQRTDGTSMDLIYQFTLGRVEPRRFISCALRNSR